MLGGLGVYLSIYTLPLLISCTKIDDYKNIQDIPHPYEQLTTSDFIAVFGDIQYYTNSSHIHRFKRSLDWIEYEAKYIHIACVLHTGDITHTNHITSQWRYFGNAIKDVTIPFISNIGDHDYTWDEHSRITSRYSTHINEFAKRPTITERIEASYEADRIENIVIRNEIHGERYDFLLLEFGPRKEVVAWAKDWVASHPDIKYILMNHEYLENGGGGRRNKNLKCEMRLKEANYTTPNELWNQLIKCNDNIAWVLCGHVGGLFAVTYEENDFGREVCQIQHNIQGQAYRYDNWLMMWEFPNHGDDAIVSIVNTRTGELYDSKDALFTFKYKY